VGICPLFYWVINVKVAEVVERVKVAVEPALSSLGLEIIDIEYRHEPVGKVLRIYIDQQQGVTVETCSQASEVISEILDNSDILEDVYTLEVSSPGIERKLTKVSHYKRFVGKAIAVKTNLARQGRKRFKGKLVKAGVDGFSVEVDGEILDFRYEEVAKANLIFTE